MMKYKNSCLVRFFIAATKLRVPRSMWLVLALTKIYAPYRYARKMYIYFSNTCCVIYILFIAASYSVYRVRTTCSQETRIEAMKQTNLTFSYVVRNQITFTTSTVNRWMTYFGLCLIIRYTELNTKVDNLDRSCGCVEVCYVSDASNASTIFYQTN